MLEALSTHPTPAAQELRHRVTEAEKIFTPWPKMRALRRAYLQHVHADIRAEIEAVNRGPFSEDAYRTAFANKIIARDEEQRQEHLADVEDIDEASWLDLNEAHLAECRWSGIHYALKLKLGGGGKPPRRKLTSSE